MSQPQWKGHNRERDLPLLGIDPDAKSDWKPVDDGRRPDNRLPIEFVQAHGANGNGGPSVQFIGARTDIGPITHGRAVGRDGRELMAYHRHIAQAYVDSRTAKDVVEQED